MERRRRWTTWAGVAIGVGLLILGIAPSAVASTGAQVQGAGARCSLATLNGTFLSAGTVLQVTGNSTVPGAWAGQVTYDGKGGARGIWSYSTNGAIARSQVSNSTYTVNPDCTGTETDTFVGFVQHWDLFIAPDGSSAAFFETDAGTVSSGYQFRNVVSHAGS